MVGHELTQHKQSSRTFFLGIYGISSVTVFLSRSRDQPKAAAKVVTQERDTNV